MMIRDDLSNKLIHLVRGDTMEEAFKKWTSILSQSQLLGGTGFIKDKYKCICFTETPISKLGYILANPDVATMRYRPLGVMVDKKWIYANGGRPVIYQPDSDYEKLPMELRYRHVRFDLDAERAIDFTWEREWRLHATSLDLKTSSTTVILPNRHWRDIFVKQKLFTASGEPWHMIVLDDLGIPIPDGLSR
jgi:hypothetical protein